MSTDTATFEGQTTVPRLRPDLQVRPGTQQGMVDVGDALSGKMYPMRDFEVSIARMLDGQRSAAQAVEAARQIGIPLSLEALKHFIAKLESYGFIDDGSHPPPAQPLPPERLTWPPRSEWNDDERKLYQQALKLFRENKLQEARALVAQMLQKRQFAAEAQDLLARIDASLAGKTTGSFSQDFSSAEASWFARGDKASAAAEAAEASWLGEADEEVPIRSSRKGLWAIVAVIVLGAIALAVPIPRQASAPFKLIAVNQAEITSPHAGTLEAVVATEGQALAQGDVVARYDLSTIKAQIAKVDDELKKLQAAARSPKVAKQKASQAKLEALLAKATHERDAAASKARGKRTPAVQKAEKQVAALQAAIQKGAAEIAAASGDVKARTAERDALVAQSRNVAVPSPQAGTVVALSAKPQQAVTQGQVIGMVADVRKLVAVVRLPEKEKDAVHPGDTVTLPLPGQPFSAAVVSVDGKSDPTTQERYVEVRLEVPNADGRLKINATGDASLKLSPQPLASRLFGG